VLLRQCNAASYAHGRYRPAKTCKIFVGILKHVFLGIHLKGEVALRLDGLTRHQPYLLGSAIQGHDELPQEVHPQQPVHRGRVREQLRDGHWEALHRRVPYGEGGKAARTAFPLLAPDGAGREGVHPGMWPPAPTEACAGGAPSLLSLSASSDADIAAVLQKISRQVIRTLCQRGYLETGIDAVAIGDDPLRDDEPELARTMAASVKQRIAFGERAGQHVRRMGSGFGDAGERPALTGPRCASVNGFSLHANTQVPAHRRDQLERLIRYTARGAVALERLAEDAHGDLVYTFTKPWSDGTTGITLSPLELLEKLAAIVPLPRVHLVRYAGCLAPHSTLREAIIPTPRQQGVDGEKAKTGTPSWSWARLLGCVLALDMATCLPPLCGRREPCDLPFCRRGSLRIIAAITQAEVIRKMLRHLKLAADPPPLTPARARQETFDWVA
jgi:hypothetical protein